MVEMISRAELYRVLRHYRYVGVTSDPEPTCGNCMAIVVSQFTLVFCRSYADLVNCGAEPLGYIRHVL